MDGVIREIRGSVAFIKGFGFNSAEKVVRVIDQQIDFFNLFFFAL